MYAIPRIIFFLILCLVGCGSLKEETIKFVVPDGYRGPLFLLVIPDHPDVQANEKGKFQFSDQGIAYLDSLEIFDGWHHLICKTTSHKLIPWEMRASADDVALRGGSLTQFGVEGIKSPVIQYYYIGTQKEFEESDKIEYLMQLRDEWNVNERQIKE